MSAPRNPDPLLHNPAIAERNRRIFRPWRIAFFFYWLAQTTGTHWPNLKFGPEVPASDKTIHVLAMASCTMLLWFTQWIRSRWLVALAVVCWAGIDEVTQGIPGLNRSVSWLDYSADVLGVIIALSWMWALAPIGVGPNRARHAFITFSLQEQFATLKTWLAIGVGALSGFIVLIALWKFFDPEHKFIPEVIAINITLVLTLLLLHKLWINTSKAIRARKPCLACGRTYDELAAGTKDLACPACEQSRALDWTHVLNAPPRKVATRQFRNAGLLLAAAVLFVFGIIFAITFIYSWLMPAGAIA
ncbi:MAG TPA: hypothetical protein VG711_01360, partial [Phycisphaerales bacterium]|nr:hypothetical protein [Phycisphaerales bacterium]